MPSFPSQNFTGNPVSRSYTRVMQTYTPTGDTYYFLNGTGSVLFSFRSSSVGGELVTADRVVTSSLSASVANTSISASYAVSASYAPSILSISASYAVTASQAISASYAPSSGPSVSSSYAATASSVLNARFTASAHSVHVQYDGTAGALYLDNIIGSDNIGTQLLAIRPDGIVATPGWGDDLVIYDVNFQGNFSGSHTGSLFGPASRATSASYAGTASVLIGSVTSASFSETSSHSSAPWITTTGSVVAFIGDVAINGLSSNSKLFINDFTITEAHVAITNAPEFGSDYVDGDTVEYLVWAYAVINGQTYYSATNQHHSVTASFDLQRFYIEIGSFGGDGVHIERNINGGGYNDAIKNSGNFYDDGFAGQPWDQPPVHTPNTPDYDTNYETRLGFSGSINSSSLENQYFGIHTNGGAYFGKPIFGTVFGTASHALVAISASQASVTNKVVGTLTTLNYTATMSIDFDASMFHSSSITSSVYLTASNLGVGKMASLKLSASANSPIYYPSAWTWLGTPPTLISGSKIGVVSLTSYGTGDRDVVGAFATQL